MLARRLSLVVLISVLCVSPVLSSAGDGLPLYQKCVTRCMTANCTEDGVSFTGRGAALQDAFARALLWSCRDDCRYHCMWRTIASLTDRGLDVPKFHGKWPFKRVFGVQEPASALFSVLNLAAHIHMYLKILRDRRFVLGETPLLPFWHLFVLVCINAWLWSTVFHTRDTPFTEFMDYTCALSMVMALFVASIVRVLHTHKVATSVILLLTLFYFVEHVKFLSQDVIDYTFNMIVNIGFGVAGSAVWLVWALVALRRGRRYAWRLLAFTLASGAALLLELFDFAPRNHLDAHALWHLATAPLPLWFYRFVIDDMDYLQTLQMIDRKTGAKFA